MGREKVDQEIGLKGALFMEGRKVQLYIEPLDAETNRAISDLLRQSIHEAVCEDTYCDDKERRDLLKVDRDHLIILTTNQDSLSLHMKVFISEGDERPHPLGTIIVVGDSPAATCRAIDQSIVAAANEEALTVLRAFPLEHSPHRKLLKSDGVIRRGPSVRKIQATKARKNVTQDARRRH